MKSSSILSLAVLFSTVAADKLIGCYKVTAGVEYVDQKDNNSRGRCGVDLCPDAGVFALQNWQCFCGKAKPMTSEKVDDSFCNTPCPGYPTDNCGGEDLKTGDLYYSFFDNLKLSNIPMVAVTSSVTSSTATSTTSTKPTSTSTSTTPTGTPSASASATSAPASKPNVAGIAAGVVVGFLAIAGILGGLYFFMRSRKRRAIEEEHRKNAVINSAKPPINSAATSFNDTRLDPVMAHRRMSDGSIADNQDYSRRILKVTN